VRRPFTLAPGLSYDCSFTGAVTATPAASTQGRRHRRGTDDDGKTRLGRRRRDGDDHERRQLDRGHEDGDADHRSRSRRHATVRRRRSDTRSADHSVTISSLVDDVYGNLRRARELL
jgi:hypothetical protein